MKDDRTAQEKFTADVRSTIAKLNKKLSKQAKRITDLELVCGTLLSRALLAQNPPGKIIK
jgi:hypothetical protein